jgi:hypothetical protein
MLQYLPNLLLKSLKVNPSIYPPQKTWEELYLIELTPGEYRNAYASKFNYIKWKQGALEQIHHPDFDETTGQFLDNLEELEYMANAYEDQMDPTTEEGEAWIYFKEEYGL